jgi:putative chitinase
MIISLEQLNDAFADATEEDVELYFEPFNQACEDYEINTPQRISAFIAQVAHESGQLTAVKENLNYSANGLMKIFKKYFTPALAAQYARKPEKIASRVYANRMGNGPESSGDGWKFRGRGLIQLTGKDNYTRFAEDMEMTLDEAIEYLETPEGAMESAAWFWDSRNLNSVADRGDITRVSQLVNGKPVNHLQDRIDLYNHALSVLA